MQSSWVEESVFVLVPTGAGWVGTSLFPRLRGALHVSSAPTQGHPSPGRSALSSLRIGERPGDTLRALPENVAAPPRVPGGCAEVLVASVVSSGCPKRSEGGCPCRNEEGAEPRADPAAGGSWFWCAPRA